MNAENDLKALQAYASAQTEELVIAELLLRVLKDAQQRPVMFGGHRAELSFLKPTAARSKTLRVAIQRRGADIAPNIPLIEEHLFDVDFIVRRTKRAT